jgi:tetratricopeptide (TPR) repeat protein
MKTILKIFTVPVAALLLLLTAGCDLDRFPYHEIPADRLDAGNIENITTGNYAKLKEEYYYKTLYQFGEYGGDNVALSGTTSDNLYYHLTFRRLPDNHYTARVWQFTYQTVVNINSTLEIVPEGESKEKDMMLGENYFLRGFLYFQLCNIFGRPYSHPDPTTNPGVPLKLTSKPDDFPPRATVADVYKQVVKDFEKAEELMTITNPSIRPKSNIFASKEVAQAFLSRVYLYMENWEKAAEYADKVIASGRYTLLQGAAYQTYPQHVPEQNTETIFAIRMVKDVDFKKYNMDWYSTGALYARIDGIGWGEMYPSAPYLDLIDETNVGETKKDLRHAFIVNEAKEFDPKLRLSYVKDSAETYINVTNEVRLESSGDYTITEKPGDYSDSTVQKETVGERVRYYVERRDDGKKYYARVENVALRNGFPRRYIYKISMQEGQSHLYSPVLIRLGEIYLNRAEAYAELGRDNEALADLNVIRARAGIPEVESSDYATKDLKTWIADERRLELAWEGFRKYDIFRRKQKLDRRFPGTHLAGSPVYFEVDWSEPYIVEYIPQSEVDAYPTPLEQNP